MAGGALNTREEARTQADFYPSAAPLTAAPSRHRATTGHLRGRVVVEAQKVLQQVLDRGYRGGAASRKKL
jgi:hypothetical protein